MLTREQLKKRSLDSADRRFDTVTLMDGSEVQLRSLNQRERREWRKSWQKKDGNIDPEKYIFCDEAMVAMCLVDESKKTVFTLEDAYKGIFDEWDTADVSDMVDGAAKLNRLNRDRTKEDVEDTIKNSEQTPGKDSSSESPEKPS